MIEMTKKYRFKNAPDYEYELLAIDMIGPFTVLGRFRNSKAKDRLWDTIRHRESGLWENDSSLDLVEVGPYDHIKKGDKVVVWDSMEKRRRYFSHVGADGLPYAFTNGDEWSSEGETTPWANCELWEKQ
jgi:hypothetical protein